VCVCLSVREHISGNTRTCYRWPWLSPPLGCRCRMLCSSGLWMTSYLSISQGSSTWPAQLIETRSTFSLGLDYKRRVRIPAAGQWTHPPRSTRSSSLVTLARPSTPSSLRITDRSFQYASPRLWNQLPASLRQPRTNLSNSDSPNPLSGTSSTVSIDSPRPLSSSITPHSFIPVLKPSFSTNPSRRNIPFLLQD